MLCTAKESASTLQPPICRFAHFFFSDILKIETKRADSYYNSNNKLSTLIRLAGNLNLSCRSTSPIKSTISFSPSTNNILWFTNISSFRSSSLIYRFKKPIGRFFLISPFLSFAFFFLPFLINFCSSKSFRRPRIVILFGH
jgi:hypothetical protein